MIVLQVGQHVAPARNRLAHPQTEEGEGHLGQDVLGYQQRRLGQEQADGLGRDVPTDQVEVRCPESAGGEDVAAFARGQDHAPDEPRRAGPVDEADDQHQQQERPGGRDAQRQHRPDREEQVEPRQGQEQLGAPHDDGVDPPAVEAGHGAEQPSHAQRQYGGHQPREERDLRARRPPPS